MENDLKCFFLTSGLNEKLLQPLDKGVCMGIVCQPPSHAPSVVQPQRFHMSLQSQPPALRKKGKGAPLPSLSLPQAPVIVVRSHLLHNSQCLGAEGVWLWYALIVLWESPLG